MHTPLSCIRQIQGVATLCLCMGTILWGGLRGHGAHSACGRLPRYKCRSLPSSAVGTRANSKYIVFGCSTIEVSPSCAAVSVIILDVAGPVPREEGHVVSIESTVPCSDTENHCRCRRGLRAECLMAAFRAGNFTVIPV